MTLYLPQISLPQISSVERYMQWLGIEHDPKAILTVKSILSDIDPTTLFGNHTLTVDRVHKKKQGAIVDAMIRLAYSRYTQGIFPVELSQKVADLQDKTEDSYLVYNTRRFPMATIKSKLFTPDDAEYFINTIFTVKEPWYFEEKTLQEVSRWATHPIYDIYHLKELKVSSMDAALDFVINKFNTYGIRSVGIFSQRVVEFIKEHNMANIRKIKADVKHSYHRQLLEEGYPLYWRDGKPWLYEITRAL